MTSALPDTLKRLFVTEIYCAEIGGSPAADLHIQALDDLCRAMAQKDTEGQAWSRKQGYVGYTSYGSVRDLSKLAPPFADLKTLIDTHVGIFARQLELNLGDKPLTLETSWVNILAPLGAHSGHFHPKCVISGTFYVSVPDGAGGIQFEDPRLPLMMNAPTRTPDARADRQFHAQVTPVRGTLLLWESWLRHEVPTNQSDKPRISISFNYA
jgi:uncharacterized protein (TIGR02466 family)